MAAVAFELAGAGKRLTRRSNISGMANYRMSAAKRDRDITAPGIYHAKVIVPPNFVLTTDNAVQSTSIHMMPGAPGDMYAAPNFEPVGLAAELSISGQIVSGNPSSKLRVELQSGEGTRQSVPVDREGMFRQQVTAGEWTVEVSDVSSGRLVKRLVSVDSAPIRLAKIDLARDELQPLPHQRVVNFDRLVSSMAVSKIPHGYEGVGWNFFVVTHNRTYSGEGYINNTVSGEYVAYNGSGHPVSIVSQAPMDFIGSHVGTAWRRAEGEKLLVVGWRNDETVYEDEIELSSMGPVYFAADYRGVTRVDFATRHYWQVVFDDMKLGLAK
jgi:hypothetical protein